MGFSGWNIDHVIFDEQVHVYTVYQIGPEGLKALSGADSSITLSKKIIQQLREGQENKNIYMRSNFNKEWYEFVIPWQSTNPLKRWVKIKKKELPNIIRMFELIQQ